MKHYFSYRYDSKSFERLPYSYNDSWILSLSRMGEQTFRAFLGQPELKPYFLMGPHNGVLSLLYLFWYLIATNVLLKAYSSSLLSYLTVPVHAKPINSIYELCALMDEGKMKLGTNPKAQ